MVSNCRVTIIHVAVFFLGYKYNLQLDFENYHNTHSTLLLSMLKTVDDVETLESLFKCSPIPVLALAPVIPYGCGVRTCCSTITEHSSEYQPEDFVLAFDSRRVASSSESRICPFAAIS